ncbi:shieldin complex subunit 2 isoform X3 [Canis lupus familiaris]|uniref:shieldin complex subunit 2 isoform X3 n=1 Tax=Canis lupus dingo TaxID=286419 RepID=UPI0002257903|nr:shieldin complex subunit 2 isoform X3 [Canis lupus dingo]XP_038390471.1 shieldin complex subunit 2 isoform X3 [Canis lupus familiaris]|eukprot:XP_013968432.1 protein FAM35A isoform X3 [Canis lupus familiaris]
MSGRSQVHIFWGAPVGPLNMTVSQERTSLMSTENPWKKIQLSYNQHSLHLRDETLEDYQVLKANGPPDLPNAHFSTNSMSEPVHVKEDFIHCISETQTVKSEKSPPSGVSDTTSSDVQICGFKGKAQHLTEDEKYQKLFSEDKKITDEQHKDQSNTFGQNFQKNFFQLDHKCTAKLDLVSSTEQINVGPGAVGTKYVPTEHHEVQNQRPEFSSLETEDKPRSEAVRKVTDLKISTDTEFLSIMTSSQVAFLSQRKSKGQNSINKGTVNMESEPKASHREIRIIEDNLIQPNDDSAGGYESGQNQAHSLELFSPVCPETKSSDTHMKPDKGLEENTGSQELFNFKDELPPSDVCIEPYGSGMLCSQLNTFHKSSVKRSWIPEEKLGHSKTLPRVLQPFKKIKLVSNAGDPTTAENQRDGKFGGIKKTSLIKNCDSKSRKYNCLVMVLSPCHVKEINIKSGPNSGCKVPLATIAVTDQSGIKKKVSLWRTAAFWALTVFPGDIILLTDVTVHEDHWVGETILQSTFTSQLLNLGSYSSVQPEDYSGIVNGVVLQDLLAYVSSEHSYLRDLPQRQPQKMNSIEFVELERLQPDILVHAVLRVVDITVLTEALYSYRGQKQKKVMLTVEQVQGQHYVLVLWGPGAAWYPQLQRKKGVILIKAQILELVIPITAGQKIALNARSSLRNILSSLPDMVYTGCAKCGLELETDKNKIYKQCYSCLPFTMKKLYYRPAVMTVADGGCNVGIRVGSQLMEKMLLNIPPDWLRRVIAPWAEVTYGAVAADLLHSLLAAGAAPWLLQVHSLFVLDDNSCPLQQECSLLDFHPDARAEDVAGPSRTTLESCALWNK